MSFREREAGDKGRSMTGTTICRGMVEIIASMHKWYVAPLRSMLLQCVVFSIGFGDDLSLKCNVGWIVAPREALIQSMVSFA